MSLANALKTPITAPAIASQYAGGNSADSLSVINITYSDVAPLAAPNNPTPIGVTIFPIDISGVSAGSNFFTFSFVYTFQYNYSTATGAVIDLYLVDVDGEANLLPAVTPQIIELGGAGVTSGQTFTGAATLTFSGVPAGNTLYFSLQKKISSAPENANISNFDFQGCLTATTATILPYQSP